MIRPRIQVETVPNPQVRVYHVTTEISRYSIHSFWRPLRDSSDKYLEEVGEIGTQLLKEVFALLGVNEVFIKPYELSVTKADAFDWEDIEPGIIGALKKTFGEKAEEVGMSGALAEVTTTVLPREEEKKKEEAPISPVPKVSNWLQRQITKGKIFLQKLQSFLRRLLRR